MLGPFKFSRKIPNALKEVQALPCAHMKGRHAERVNLVRAL